MKPWFQIAFVVVGVAALAAVAGARLGGWLAGPDEPQVARAAPVPAARTASESGACLDEAELRRVIREEMAAAGMGRASASAEPAPAAAQPAAAQAAASPPVPVSSPEQVDFVNRRMDDYIRAGVISQSEMTRLQIDIARLDPVARRAAMQKLVRAMNSGALDGRL